MEVVDQIIKGKIKHGMALVRWDICTIVTYPGSCTTYKFSSVLVQPDLNPKIDTPLFATNANPLPFSQGKNLGL